MSGTSAEAEFDQWIADVLALARTHLGVEQLESPLERLRNSAVTGSIDRGVAVSRLAGLAHEWPPGAVEILEYVLRDTQWSELRDVLIQVEVGAADFRHRNLAKQVLEVYEKDWPSGEIYNRYR